MTCAYNTLNGESEGGGYAASMRLLCETFDSFSNAGAPKRAELFKFRDFAQFIEAGFVRRVVKLGEQTRDGPIGMAGFGPIQKVASLSFAFFDDTEIPSTIVAFNDLLDHAFAPEAVLNFPARLARLAYLKQRAAKLEPVTNVHTLFGYARGDKVFTKGRRVIQQFMVIQLLCPPTIVVGRVKVHGHIRPAMVFGVGLDIADDAVCADGCCTFDRGFDERA